MVPIEVREVRKSDFQKTGERQKHGHVEVKSDLGIG
jgi:hypothetical protein